MSKFIKFREPEHLDNIAASETLWNKAIATKLTQIYSELSVRMQLINLMAVESQNSWKNFFRTMDSWSGNCVLGTDKIYPIYSRLQPLGLEFMYGQVFVA